MIFIQLKQQLQSLAKLLSSLTNNQYTHQIEHLGNASIGGHTRHIIELVQCALKGYETGTIDYINRSRDLRLENDRSFAFSILEQIQMLINLPDKELKILSEGSNEISELKVNTSYFREIVYNAEHTIHHLALIKVALIEMNLKMVDDDFGMAYSTIKYKANLTISN